MIAWIVAITIWFNFVTGALIPITPHLNEEMAGVAFSSFALIKMLVLVPAGRIGDRIGHFNGLFVALVSQAVTVALIILAPQYVWAARGTEGITLAFGTVSALSLLRLYAGTTGEFGKSISLMMGIGSSGYLLGPFFGYLLPIHLSLSILFGASSLIALAHFAFAGDHRRRVRDVLKSAAGPDTTPWVLVLCFALAKGIGVGTEPLLGWWATQSIQLSPALAGCTFVVAGLGFMAGNFKSSLTRAWLVLPGLLGLELALAGTHWLWWPSVFLIGLFSGTCINLLLSRLGWNKPENIGLQNSKWLVLSDFPMMIAPVVLWNVRTQPDWLFRAPILFGAVLTVMVLMRGRI